MSSPLHMKSITPKKINYFSNGTGRDTYISSMNTAASFPSLNLPKISQNSQEKIHESSSSLSFRFKKINSQKYSSLDNKMVHYVSDGSGRDLYIKINEGGLTSFHPRSNVDGYFENNLRGYQKIRMISKNASSINGNFLPPIQKTKTIELKKKQNILTQRLAVPKQVRAITLCDDLKINNAAQVLHTQG